MLRHLRGFARTLLYLLALSNFAALPAFAGEQSGDIEGILCTVRYNWPEYVNQGYFPVEVELHNTNDQEVSISMEAEQSWGAEDLVRRDVKLGADERFSFEMLLRARHRGQNQYRVTFEALGEEMRISSIGGGGYARGGYERTTLYASAEKVLAGVDGEKGRWTEEWTAGSQSLKHTPGHGRSVLGAVTFDELSTSWQAYSCLDSVVLDYSRGQPSPEVLSAILDWARSGGKLIVAGITRQQLVRMQTFEALLEERFKLLPEKDHDRLVAHGLQSYRCGFGVLLVQSEMVEGLEIMEGAKTGDSVAHTADSVIFPVSWMRNSFGRYSRMQDAMGTLGKFDTLQLRALMFLMIAFALLMGPVNFIWVKRMRKPMMILVTVPTIALAASLSLLLYGILAQGLDIKSMTSTWAVLDQRSGHGTTVETRHVFAGSAPGDGMRPQENTMVYPERKFWTGGHRQRYRFVQDLDDGRLLGGDFFPTREPVGQMIISNRDIRLRLDVKAVGDQVVVSNALGARVEGLLLRDEEGDYHHLDRPVQQGEEVTLQAGGSSAKSVEWSEDMRWFWGEGATRLVPGTYIARLDRSSTADDCGIEVNVLEGSHVVLGILDSSQGDPR